MKKSKNYQKNKSLLNDLSPKDLKNINEIEREAIANYSGQLSTLASALGFYRIGLEVGWRVLVLVYHRATIKKYEKILGIDIKEHFPEEGPSSERSLGLRIAKRIGKFWEIVRGTEKVPDKSDIT